MAKKASLALSAAIVLLSGWGVLAALDWPLKAKLFPLVIGIPLFCLASAEALWTLFGSASVEQARDVALTEGAPQSRTLVATAWIGGFFAAILLLGFPIAVPLFVFLYLVIQGRERWMFAAVFSAVVWGLFYGLFDLLLHLPFPAGYAVSLILPAM